MANADIVIIGPGEYPLLAELYGQVFRPAQDQAYFHRRLDGRRNVLVMVAQLEKRPVGFSCGYELRPSTYYSWIMGVLSDARGMAIGTQLMVAERSWAKSHGYEMMRLECHNQDRTLLQMAIRDGYDVVGIRWDSRTVSNLVIFEKQLDEEDE